MEDNRQPPKTFTGSREEYIQYIERIKAEGLNADQKDKTEWEEYLDALAQGQLMYQYNQWLQHQEKVE